MSRFRPGPVKPVRSARERSLDVLRRAAANIEELEERRLFAAELVLTNVNVSVPSNTTVEAGNPIIYQVTVRNTGDDFATNVVLTDFYSTASQPDQARFARIRQIGGPAFNISAPPPDSTGPITATIGQLNSALAATFEITLNVDVGAEENTVVTNTATVSRDTAPTGDPGDNPSNNTQSVTTTVTPRADLQVTSVVQEAVVGAPALVTANNVVAGLKATYTVTVRNAGPSTARNVTFSNVVPSLTTFESFRQVSGPAFTIPANVGTPLPTVGGGGTATAFISALAPLTDVVFQITVNVGANAPDLSTVTNSGEIRSNTFDPTNGNNVGFFTSGIEIQTDVLITSSVDTPPEIEGTFFPYTVIVQNRGPSDAQGVNFSWTTPNVANTGELGVYYPDPAPGRNGPNAPPPSDYISGEQFAVNTPGSLTQPPGPKGTFTTQPRTLPAGSGSVYQFNVGTPTTQEFIQNSTIRTSSPDYNGANNDFVSTFFVDDAPLVTQQAPNVEGNAGQQVDEVLLRFTDTNDWRGNVVTPNFTTQPGRNGQLNEFQATVNWGDGTTTAGVISIDGTGTYIVSGAHTYAASGVYSVQVLVTGNGSSTAVGPSVAIIGNAARGAGQVGGLKFTENVSETKQVGVFSAGNAPAGTNFSGVITWGDRTAPSPALLTATGPTTFSVTGTHLYADQGTYNGSFTITGSDGVTNTATMIVVVDDRAVVATPFDIAAQTNVQVTDVRVATFTDPGGPDAPGTYVAEINWGDGTVPSQGTVTVTPNTTTGEFTVTGTHTYTTAGVYSMSVRITHGSAPATTVLPTATVSNTPPGPVNPAVVATPVNSTAFANLPTTVTVATFTDPGPDGPVTEYSAVINWGDTTAPSVGTITYNPGNGVYTVEGTHTYAAAGTYNTTVTIRHGNSPNAIVNPTVTVTVSTAVPLAAAPVNVSALRNVESTNVAVATFTDDAPSPVGAYTAVIDWGDGTPTSAGSISVNNGRYTVSGTHTYVTSGSYNMTVTIRKAGLPDAVVRPNATVAENPPVEATPVNVSAEAGVAATNVVVATFTDPAQDLPTANYAVVIDWGDGTPTSAGALTYNAAAAVYTVTGTHTFFATGTYNMTVTIRKANTQDEVVNPVATVTADPPAPAVNATPVNFAAQAGVATTNVVATFTDPGPNLPTASYTVVIDWGDGTATSNGAVTYDAASRVYTVNGTHSYFATGTYNMTVTVQKANTQDAVVRPVATVRADPAPPGVNATPVNFSAQAGVATTGVVATFTDPGQDEPTANYTVVIDWGDGTATSAGAVTYDVASAVYTVNGTHSYFATGTYNMTVTIRKANTQDAVVSPVARIGADAALPVTGVPVSAARNIPVTNVAVATFTDPGPQRPTGDYSATIDWGDGTAASTGTISYNAAADEYTVRGTHTFAASGTYNMTVTVRASGRPDATARPVATVVDNPPVNGTGVNVQAFAGVAATNVTVATFTDPGLDGPAASYTAVIDWGDASATSPGTVAYDAASGVYTVTGTHTYNAAGTYPMTVTIRKANYQDEVLSPVATVTVPPNVSNTAPVTFTGVEGRNLTNVIAGRFTSLDPVATPADFRATINWGDGLPASTGSIVQSAPGQFNVTGTHTYRNDGRYTVSVTVSSVTQPGAPTQLSSQAAITDARLQGVSRLFTAPRGSSFNGMIAQVIDGNSFDTNAGEYSAVIDWGDGTGTSAGTVNYNASLGRFEVRGTHTYTVASPSSGFAVKVSVRDGLSRIDITSTAKVL